jgi:hypothetical protein
MTRSRWFSISLGGIEMELKIFIISCTLHKSECVAHVFVCDARSNATCAICGATVLSSRERDIKDGGEMKRFPFKNHLHKVKPIFFTAGLKKRIRGRKELRWHGCWGEELLIFLWFFSLKFLFLMFFSYFNVFQDFKYFNDFFFKF